MDNADVTEETDKWGKGDYTPRPPGLGLDSRLTKAAATIEALTADLAAAQAERDDWRTSFSNMVEAQADIIEHIYRVAVDPLARDLAAAQERETAAIAAYNNLYVAHQITNQGFSAAIGRAESAEADNAALLESVKSFAFSAEEDDDPRCRWVRLQVGTSDLAEARAIVEQPHPGEAQQARLRAAEGLELFVGHLENCAWAPDCTCGLDAALEAWKKAQP